MNVIDNGVKEVLCYARIITEDVLCFEVTYKDFYGSVRNIHVTTLKDIEKKRWTE